MNRLAMLILFTIAVLFVSCSESRSRSFNNTPDQDEPVIACNETPPVNPVVSIGLSLDDIDRRVRLGSIITYTMTSGGQRLDTLEGDIDFVITLPIRLTLQTFSIVVPSGTVEVSGVKGNIITWSLPVDSIGDAISFDVRVDDPVSECIGGQAFSVLVDVNTDAFICKDTSFPVSVNLTANATSPTLLITDSPDDANPDDHYFNLDNVAANASGFEMGSASADIIRDAGEGEFANWRSTITIPQGNWSDLSYSDDLGVNDGVSGLSVVAGLINWTVGANSGSIAVTPGATGFTASLASIGIALGSTDATGEILDIQYSTIDPDRSFSVLSYIRRSTLTLSNLGAGNGNCGDGTTSYISGDFIRVERANARLRLDAPNSVAATIPFDVTLTIDGTTDLTSFDLAFGLNLTANYTYDNATAPVFGGYFSTVTPVQPDGNLPSFTLSTLPAGETGTIQLRLTKLATAVGNLAINGEIAFNSEQTRITNPGVGFYSDTNPAVTPGASDNCGDSNDFCLIFISNATSTANFDNTTNGGVVGDSDGNGVEEADAICNADAAKPNTNNYKALIVSDGLRVACAEANCSEATTGSLDWPLLADTEYRLSDRTTSVTTTDANALFSFPLSNTINIQNAWTGIETDWTLAGDIGTCFGWTSSNIIDVARTGDLNQVDIRSISNGINNCSIGSNRLICVEQP